MPDVRFIGCLHLSHLTIAKCRGFETFEEHDEWLIKQWNNTIRKKDDLTFILGDVTMEKSTPYYLLDRLVGRKIVVLGNHDKHQDVRKLLNHVESVAGMIDYKGYVLTHCPIHPSEIGSCRGNIHAHIHHNSLPIVNVNRMYNDIENNPIVSTENKYFHVDAYNIDFKPKTLIELCNLQEMKDNKV